jgi:hypothetical protein
MFKIWIINESGLGVGDVEGELNRRAALLQPTHLWTTTSLPPAIGVTRERVAPSTISRSDVSPNDAAVLLAHARPKDNKLSDPKWWRQFRTVIPVIETSNDVSKIPLCLQGVNALVRSRHDNWPAVLADDVFAQAVLARPTRSVFISYRRNESLDVARQLAGALADEGFDVFLDERSIARGTEFAREITYRLSDVDMLVVLATSGFDKSTWVRREIELATLSNIGVLAIDWSGVPVATRPFLQTLMSDQICPAKLESGQTVLDKDSLREAVSRIYELRVASIARRVDNLLPAAALRLAQRAAALHGGVRLSMGERLGEIVAREPVTNDPLEVVAALPFRPTPVAVWNARSGWRGAPVVRCVYQEVLHRDPRVRSLAWALRPHRPAVEVDRV